MAGIDNVQGGSLPMQTFKAAGLDEPAVLPQAAPQSRGTGSLGDANQAQSGQAVLKAAAQSNISAPPIGQDLRYQDRTPQNGGSNVGADPEMFVAQGVDKEIKQKVPDAPPEPVKAIDSIMAFAANIVRLALGEDKSFRSWGDPHEKTGDGLQLDNQLTGRFVAFKSDEGDLELQKDQGPDQSGRWPGMTLNHAVAMKVGENRLSYDLAQSGSLVVNGKRVPWQDGSTTLGDGTIVAIAGNKLSVFSPRGDALNVERMGDDSYLNLEGKISGQRPQGSVQGSLGNFDGDGNATNDLVSRGGTSVPVETGKGRNSWEQIVYTPQIDTFLKSWMLKPGESLF